MSGASIQAAIDQGLAQLKARHLRQEKATAAGPQAGSASYVRREPRKRGPFAVVPESLLEDRRLSTDARLVLAWIHGKPNDWKFLIGAMQARLGISDRVWARVKRELKGVGLIPPNDPHREGFDWVTSLDTTSYE